MKIYNTLTRKKQEFKSLKKERVLMYHCGPTVYWTQHIGNMRAMVLADLVVRTFNYLGYKVKLVRNYTDVGHLTSDADLGQDKMNEAAKKEKTSPEKIAEKYIRIFEKDIHALNVPDADKKPKATENIKDMIKAVKILLQKGYAYTTPLAIYFDVSKAKDYNRLSRQNLKDLMKEAGKAKVSDSDKKNPADFALWFFKAGKHQKALQTWSSPFNSPLVKDGQGFPGWHLECSVLANKFLGKTIDVHMGGVEHISIHHTNEIAQSEAINDAPFVNFWLHNEHLLVDNKKMSKSAGSAYSLQEILDKNYEPLVLRYFFLQAHYRSKQNFTWQALEGSRIALDKLRNFINYPLANEQGAHKKDSSSLSSPQDKLKKIFIQYISDDFNIPAALALLWQVVKSDLPYKDKKKLILDFDQIFGLNLNKIKKEKINIPKNVKKLAEQRQRARENKNWQLADRLRYEIEKNGFFVEDSPTGIILKKK